MEEVSNARQLAIGALSAAFVSGKGEEEDRAILERVLAMPDEVEQLRILQIWCDALWRGSVQARKIN